MHRVITTMLMLGLLVSVVAFGSVIVNMRADIDENRVDLREHVRAALYYMDQFNQMRERAERSNGSRVAKEVEKLNGN